MKTSQQTPSEEGHGHHPHPHDEAPSACCGHSHGEQGVSWQNRSLAVAAVLATLGLLGEHVFSWPRTLCMALQAAAMVGAGWFLMPEAVQSVLRLRPNINTLVVMASVGAAVIGAWGEAAVVVVLFGVAEWLEAFSIGRARRAISGVLRLAPQRVRVQDVKGGWVEVNLEDVAAGDVIEIRPGERIPVDAVVLAGTSEVNQAPITGEPLPQAKSAGDSLFAGTLNGSGLLTARASKPYRDSTLAKIIRLVEEAQQQRAPTQRFIEKFSSVYTPLVPLVALLVFAIPVLFQDGDPKAWAYRAFTVLVIACPCALVVSTPVGIVCGLARLARRGVLVKGGVYLELLGKMRALAVDKTGTLTEGRPRVLEVVPWDGKSSAEILRVAASLAQKSTHPLARAIVCHAQSQGIATSEPWGIENLAGRGSRGQLDGHQFAVGSQRLMRELGLSTPELEQRLDSIQSQGHSVAVLAHHPHDGCSGEVWGILVIGDALRPQAAQAVAALHQAGVPHVVMLSGDHSAAVQHVAAQVGIEEFQGNLLPEQKTDAVRILRGTHGVVGMVGDGVNDAPALAAASFGIAMGASGSDTAMETADVALMKDDLLALVDALHVSRRVMRIIYFNIGFALLLKAVFLVLGVTGHTSLWLAILADTGATVLVVLNALRLLLSAEPSSARSARPVLHIG
jgi:Cd2+/Zn2+-exporting ATPase